MWCMLHLYVCFIWGFKEKNLSLTGKVLGLDPRELMLGYAGSQHGEMIDIMPGSV